MHSGRLYFHTMTQRKMIGLGNASFVWDKKFLQTFQTLSIISHILLHLVIFCLTFLSISAQFPVVISHHSWFSLFATYNTFPPGQIGLLISSFVFLLTSLSSSLCYCQRTRVRTHTRTYAHTHACMQTNK